MNVRTDAISIGRPMGLPPPLHPVSAEPAGSRDIEVDHLSIQLVRKPADLRELAGLRSQIDLAAAIAADPHFLTREKKETSWAWSSPSSCMAS